MAFQRGDVILVPFPFSDQQTSKVRPAVVVSSADYHAEEPDLLLAAITSQLRAATGPLDYILSDWQGAGLRFPSAFKPVLATIAPARILHTVGTLAAADLAAIEARLRRALGL
ncbi:MAG: type II toxin-antitoxin system PemK/MazF family toxin [Thermomicrobiales bacterium]